jgi:hypothetical protein
MLGDVLMNMTYFQGRLDASLARVKAAIDPCARVAHEGMARGYRSILANYGYAEEAPSRERPGDKDLIFVQGDNDAAVECWVNEGGATVGGAR